MVNVKNIKKALNNWELYGDVTIDPKTGVVDVNDLVSAVQGLTEIGLQFGTVEGFDASAASLRSLAGSPRHCKGVFNIQNNKLTTLHGASAHVGSLFAGGNLLANLDGLPAQIDRDIELVVNRLTSLDGLPATVHGFLSISYNRLTNLRGISSTIEGDIRCQDNPLENLDSWPTRIDGQVWITWHKNLPLLKTLIARKGVVCVKAPRVVQNILWAHAGQGQQGSLACAAELADAGYKGNARW